MRRLIVFLLSLLVSLNAAYAAGVGICDALEGRAQETSTTTHFGHHTHAHDDPHEHENVDDRATTSTSDSSAPSNGEHTQIADHGHAHVHPSFSVIPAGFLPAGRIAGRSPLITAPSHLRASQPLVPLDRPPRNRSV